MTMKELGRNIFIPMPMAVIGTVKDGRNNFMAAGWVTRANANPPMIAAGIGNNHFTAALINETRAFSVNICGSELLLAIDYSGIVSGEKTDKSGLFKTFAGKSTGVPLIEGSIAALECRIAETVKLPSNTLFIGEIVSAWGDERFASGNFPDYKKGNAYFLTMPDNNYWSMGQSIGKAWSDGKNYK